MAFDYLHDDYYQMSDLMQVRSETGFVINDCYEIGYYGAYGVGTDRVIDGKLDPTDMFVVYLRRYFDTGGEGRLWGGATGNGDGLLGADLWLPLGKGFALENRINYMIPKQGTGATAQPRESWGFVIQLVWYPGQNAACMKHNPFRRCSTWPTTRCSWSTGWPSATQVVIGVRASTHPTVSRRG